MTTDIAFTTEQEFKKYAEKYEDQTFVVHKNVVYNVTEFLDTHPGGPAFILDFKNMDITDAFHNDEYHEHSDNALRMLYKYKIGHIQQKDGKQVEKTETEEYPKITKERIYYKDFSVDLTRGMVPQVLKMTKKQYMHMIHNPIHLPYARLFDSDLFEGMSRNPWYRIPMLWVPVLLYLLYIGLTGTFETNSSFDAYLIIGSPAFSILAVIATFLFGILFWTFAEYVLHRAVFHFDTPLPDNKWALWLHFIIHGIHHTIPMDADRLVFPPALGVITYCILYPTMMNVFLGNFGRILAAGVVLGYICYDMTHIYIHHCQPFIEHLKEMKRYHNKHHYVDGDKGYGITSKLWDKVFRTELL